MRAHLPSPRWWLLALSCVLILPAVANPGRVSVTFTSPQQFDSCTHDAGIDITTNPGAAQLAPVEFNGMTMGNRYGKASAEKAFWGKKVFQLDAPQSAGAKLYVFREVKKATFNGEAIAFHLQGYGNYYVADIRPGLLRAGANEFVIRDKVCPTLVDTEAAPRTSFVSVDEGASWQPAAGEFLAQLCLYRHPLRGTITSGVVDLANPENENIICPQITVKRVQVISRSALPQGTAIALEARSGSTVRPDAAWSAWGTAGNVKPARFLQWRATLRTTNHCVTPVLDQVFITADVDRKAAVGLTVQPFDNPRIVRSSLDFAWQVPSPKLAYLRKNWKVDEIVAPGQTDIDKFILLRNWARRQWPHNEGSCIRPWDAVNILSAPEGDHGMCGHFAIVFKQCALSLGYNARLLGLAHHAVAEIWSKQYRKWIVIDVECVQAEGFDRYGTAIYTDKRTGIPLGALELHRAWKNNDTENVVQQYYMTDEQGEYRLHERVYGKEEYNNYAIFFYPPRNNHLDQAQPWEEAAGNDYLHSDGYYWWSDGPYPDCAEWSHFTCREGDINFTLEQAAVTLTATGSPAKLTVAVDTASPNFREFRYRVNGGTWKSLAGTKEDAISVHGQFEWWLSAGANTLEILPRNAFGMDGIPTTVTVVKK
ncbi:MAG: transglutaminase domain-containing protein [Armatimonadota bacterium]